MATDTGSCFERTYKAISSLSDDGDLRDRLGYAWSSFMSLRVDDFPAELRERVSALRTEFQQACAAGSTLDEQKQAAKSMLAVYTHVARLEGTFADLL
jgi:hypothetical protein